MLFGEQEIFRINRSDPNLIQSDPNKVEVVLDEGETQDKSERSKIDPNEIEALMKLVKKSPSISRAELAKQLHLSERQVRRIIERLRGEERLIRRGGTRGEWIIPEN